MLDAYNDNQLSSGWPALDKLVLLRREQTSPLIMMQHASFATRTFVSVALLLTLQHDAELSTALLNLHCSANLECGLHNLQLADKASPELSWNMMAHKMHLSVSLLRCSGNCCMFGNPQP